MDVTEEVKAGSVVLNAAIIGGAKEVKTLEERKSPAYSGCWNNIFLSIFYWQHGNYHATIFSATLSISISSISSNCFFFCFLFAHYIFL
jgi:hypothetical protein